MLDSVFELVLKILLRSHSSTSSSHPKGPASYDATAAVAAARRAAAAAYVKPGTPNFVQNSSCNISMECG